MLIIVVVCTKCGEVSERVSRSGQRARKSCPHCNGTLIQKVVVTKP